MAEILIFKGGSVGQSFSGQTFSVNFQNFYPSPNTGAGAALLTLFSPIFKLSARPKRVGNLKAVAEVEDLQKVPGPQKVLKVANQAEVTGPAAANEAVKALNLAEARAVTPCRNTRFTSRIAKV